MIYAGCDLGIISAKAVIIKNGHVLAAEILPYKNHPSQAAVTVMENAVNKAGIDHDKIAYCMATGFGRRSVKFADGTIHEVGCLHRAVRELNPDIRTVIDVGGHTLQTFRLNDRGNISENVAFTRCVNGTGLALDVFSRVLEMPLGHMCDMAMESTQPIPLTSQCVVLAESEIISRVNEGKDLKDITAGILSFVAFRISSIVRKVKITSPVAFVGGVAKNRFIKRHLEKSLDLSFDPISGMNPQAISAYGAALAAGDEHAAAS